jgi:hypothetical protein
MTRGLNFLFDGTVTSVAGYNGISDSGAYGWAMPQDPKGATVTSKMNPGYFINYRGRQFNHGDFTPYAVERTGIGENVTPNDQSDTSVPELVKWSERYPSLKLYPKDFLYCRDLEKYPNNRLVVLRRFAQPVGNNLFLPGKMGQYPHPISTVVSWVNPEEDGFFNFSFGEKWEQQSEDFFDILKGAMQKISGGGGGNVVTNALQKQLFQNILGSMGVTNLSFEDFYGNPSIIKSTSRRSTGGDGFNFDFNYTLTANYEMRHLVGPNNAHIDSQVAMLDIMANLIKMGSSDSIFRLSTGFSMFASKTLNAMAAGRTSQILQEILKGAISAAKSMINSVVEMLKADLDKIKAGGVDAAKEVAVQRLTQLADATIQGIIAEHKVKLEASIAGSSGLPNAPWHLTIGNPKKPVVSIGDMVVDKVELKGKNELGYDDWPTEIEAKITLKNARPLGAQEIENIFNGAQQRIYYRSIINIKDQDNKIILNLDDKELVEFKKTEEERLKVVSTNNKKENTSTGQASTATQEAATNSNPTPSGSDKNPLPIKTASNASSTENTKSSTGASTPTVEIPQITQFK